MVSISLKNSGENPLLIFTFPNYLTEYDAKEAIKKWAAYHHEQAEKQFILVWDCTKLKDYDPMARVSWQEALKELQHQFKFVYLVSGSKMVRVGASLMAGFTPYSIKNVASLEEIPELQQL